MDQLELFSTHDWPFVTQPDTPLSLLEHTDPKPSCRSRRQMPGHVLFFDRLLILANISDHINLYPPANLTTLQSLLHAIDTCPFDFLKKSCLIYYLLKEYGDKREQAFATERLIPFHFTGGIDGLWALDHSMWTLAVSSFSNPAVSPDFIPDIMTCLATLPPIDQRSRHLLSFYQFVNPPLDLPAAILVLRAMSALGRMRSAWALQRTFQRPDRDQLIQAMLGACFGLNDHTRPYSVSLQTLSGFAFDELEDSILEDFCKSSPAILSQPNAVVAIHFYLNKLTGEARYIEAIRFEQGLAGSNSIQNDPDIDRVIKGIKDILPEVQRNMLDLELDAITSKEPSRLVAEAGSIASKSSRDSPRPHYDIGQLAWDAPTPAPDLPHPTSLAEAREQRELKNPRAQIFDQPHSLPLSASPLLRRTGPPGSIQKRNEPQKTLLKALAFQSVQHTPSKSTSHLVHLTTVTEGHPTHSTSDRRQSTMDAVMATPPRPLSNDQPLQEAEPRSTPRFKHFVGPARLPLSKSSTGSTPAPISGRAPKLDGSPFHHLDSNSKNHAAKPPSSQNGTQDRWPTRIAFTPRRPIVSRKSEVASRRPGPNSQPMV
ncbi:hypothetical protein CROQUDRAFT_210317 [Cronartium quercuum f. sp. fusiforme G11]|uniref:ELYS-like domain-containing protein n=1 Tax=Cronartium quercuum f. sp. fusiforme G11 TaxID=708437 RepID=A0A9P6T8Q5_9BASI|nr:hypothetical protein CROQUDRAFT_210317 [Cronartium quercuum f. sp. fusiforme G11]